MYAALLKAGATLAAGEPSAEQAAAIGKQILVAWSAHGFQDGHGRILSIPSQFCDDDGRSNVGTTAGAGLAVARDVIDSVQAQDLLMYVSTLSDADAKQINAFHSAMFELLRKNSELRKNRHSGKFTYLLRCSAILRQDREWCGSHDHRRRPTVSAKPVDHRP